MTVPPLPVWLSGDLTTHEGTEERPYSLPVPMPLQQSSLWHGTERAQCPPEKPALLSSSALTWRKGNSFLREPNRFSLRVQNSGFFFLSHLLVLNILNAIICGKKPTKPHQVQEKITVFA